MAEVEYHLVSGFPGYRIGTDGTVWSQLVFSRWKDRSDDWHRLKPQLRRGYLRVGLTRNRKLHWRSVHRLVLETFVGKCPLGHEACHNDGNRKNNVLQNLRWDTPEANGCDKRLHGTIARGSRNSSAKITERDVPLIRELRTSGHSYGEIASRFDITRATVIALLKGRTWTHV
ncbi:HNH endonuclease [Pirellulaceae bacterium SH501]